ncbi:cation transporter [Phormidium sp. LEGE 05292]|nr:cation transporter [Phormidium sp. LEGE 05292]MBE9227751.1 cation transporter [Phormidium sp. LEGE 05292]
MGDDRNHHHHHEHTHGLTNYSRAFTIGLILNFGFMFIEAIYGFLAHSVALLADAGHNLSDVLGLVLASIPRFVMETLASKKHEIQTRICRSPS